MARWDITDLEESDCMPPELYQEVDFVSPPPRLPHGHVGREAPLKSGNLTPLRDRLKFLVRQKGLIPY